MISLPLETWVSLAALLGVGITLYTTLRSSVRQVRDDLRSDLRRVESTLSARLDGVDARFDRLDTRVDDVRTELKADIAKLDDRVYALAVGLRPPLEPAGPAA